MIATTLVTSVGAIAQSKPGPPVNVRLVAVGDSFVTVAWDAPETVAETAPTGYLLWYRKAAVEPGSQPGVATGWYGSDPVDAAAELETTIRDLTNGVWYEIRVQSLGGAWSEQTVPARPGSQPADKGLPDQPRDVAIAEEGSGSVTVTWDAPGDDGSAPVTGYGVWYIRQQDRWPDNADDVVWTRSGGKLPPDARRHKVEGLVDYHEYGVVVAAINQTGRGPFSEELVAEANGDDLGPLGLIADHRFAKAYSLGTDTWEVWICDPPGADADIDLPSILALLNREIPPYFSWLSGGRYRPEFVGGGTSKADDPKRSSTSSSCDERIAGAAGGTADAGLIILDQVHGISSASPGSYEQIFVDGMEQVDGGSFPENGRAAWTVAGSVLPVSAYCPNCGDPDHIHLDFVVHEMGHTLEFPHSFGGKIPRDSGVHEGDNPMDLMSGGPADPWISTTGLVVGTIAVNRYAAGWIEPSDIAIHDDGIASYLLAPIGVSGTQMLAIPTGVSGVFVSLGARVAKGYDRGIAAEGVEVYRVDQRASACGHKEYATEHSGPLRCAGTDRRTQQVPPPRGADLTQEGVLEELSDHVYGPGDELTVEGFRVEVTERVGDRFRVWIGNPYKGTFADDENNVHEESIEFLANRGITDGCAPDLKMYCPDQPVTRAQLATFLIRALGETGASTSGPSRFTDVPDDSWYRPYVERLAELEITAGYPDGTFRPKELVTRAHMAFFLTSAFDALAPVETPTGVFDDVPAEVSYAAAVEGILAAGVTQGCDKTPGRNYCPEEPVRRDQLATLLARALRISG